MNRTFRTAALATAALLLAPVVTATIARAQGTEVAETPIAAIPSNVEMVPRSNQIPAIGGSSKGAGIVQLRLIQLGFWNSASGKYDQSTQQAVLALQKYLGLKRTGKVDQTTANWMTVMTERAHGTSTVGDLVEVDKTRQLLFVVKDGKTLWTFNTSTGSGKPYEAVNKNDPTKIETGDAQTPNGLWSVNRQRSEGWWEGDLGKIYRPKYFVGGVAIHGMTSIPAYPASHGCVRVSVAAMDFIWEAKLVPLRTPVWVHGG